MYHDVLSDDDVNYDVTFEADLIAHGVCESGSEGTRLVLGLQMIWDQVVEVTSRDFNEVYPANGEGVADFTIPVADGATPSSGGMEGLEVILHLGR